MHLIGCNAHQMGGYPWLAYGVWHWHRHGFVGRWRTNAAHSRDRQSGASLCSASDGQAGPTAPGDDVAMGAVLLIVVGGFLGAGKTTALTWLAQSLEALGKRTAVVMNDQGDMLVDSALGRSIGLTIAEVTGGCFCCRFDELAAKTISLVEQQSVEVVLAEAVGSCTDLSATVIRPLRAYFGERFAVAPLTVLVDPARLRELQVADDSMSARMRYLFDKQLEDACTLVLTKQDLLAPADLAPLLNALAE